MVISTVNARRPGGHVDNVYGLSPKWFDYIDEPTAKRLMAPKEVAEEIDPLAGLGLEL